MTVWRKTYPAACSCDKNFQPCQKPLLLLLQPSFNKEGLHNILHVKQFFCIISPRVSIRKNISKTAFYLINQLAY